MPERWMDAFEDAMARGLNSFTEFPLDGYVDHHSTDQQLPFLVESASIHENKTWHHESQHKSSPVLSTQALFPEPKAFFRDVKGFLPASVSNTGQLQILQPNGEGAWGKCLPHYQNPQLEDADIWMLDLLDNSQQSMSNAPGLSPWVSQMNAAFEEIPPLDFSCPTGLAGLQLQEEAVRFSEEESVSHPTQQSSDPQPSESSQTVSITDYALNYGEVSFLNPTPETRRCAKSSKPGKTAKTPKAAKTPKTPKTSKTPKTLKTPKTAKKEKTDQSEHVKRERQRRDQMSVKLSTLQSLLPAPTASNGYKRDRASIIDDTGHYLRVLQERVEELKKSLAKLKLEKASRRPAAGRSEPVRLAELNRAGRSRPAPLVEFHVQVEGQAGVTLEKCRCRPDFLSSTMKLLYLLNLDVCRFTITKAFEHSICVIVAKRRLSTSNQTPTPAAISSAFKSSLHEKTTTK